MAAITMISALNRFSRIVTLMANEQRRNQLLSGFQSLRVIPSSPMIASVPSAKLPKR